MYFDHNATTPLCPPAREAWLRVHDRLWHNASSLYREAAAARSELERCRERLAELTGTDDPDSFVFTSGATEAANGFFASLAGEGRGHESANFSVVHSPFEHPAVREPARRWGRVETMPLDAWEAWGAEASERAVKPVPAAWMAANNETGEIFPWLRWLGAGEGALPGARAVLCDASQWFGKLPADAFAGDGPPVIGCAHKFGGPKGVGFARTTGWPAARRSWQLGGPQEHGLRAGTEDVAGVAAMVAALEWCEEQLPGDPGPRNAFEHDLGWPVVAADRPRLWNTSMVVAPRHSNKLWVARLSQRGIQCSTGSACSSGGAGDSQVLAAMGMPADDARRALRFSSGWSTTPADWHTLRRTLAAVLQELDDR